MVLQQMGRLIPTPLNITLIYYENLTICVERGLLSTILDTNRYYVMDN
jgi:hypothetical protein